MVPVLRAHWWEDHCLVQPQEASFIALEPQKSIIHLIFSVNSGPLEKEMATHSNTLAWRIQWTEGRDRL